MKADMNTGRPIRAAALALCAAVLITAVAGCSGDTGTAEGYLNNCSSCHGRDGEGLRSLYPPLKDSAYLSQQLDQLPCLLVNGIASPFGSTDSTPRMRMPSFAHLSSDDLYAVIAYLSATWGTAGKTVSRQEVEAWLSECR
jgi:mono/diheme cytochrome c family protein